MPYSYSTSLTCAFHFIEQLCYFTTIAKTIAYEKNTFSDHHYNSNHSYE